MPFSRTRPLLAVLGTVVLALTGAACAPKQTPTGAGGSASAATCTPSKLPLLTKGTLTIGADSPAYPPWFEHNNPRNGQGYESGVAYAVAKQLGFTKSQVKWVVVPFNNSFAPGPKHFDFYLSQVSILKSREHAVDFSSGYYNASQAVIALKGTPAAKASTLAELKQLHLGAETGTTSLLAIRDGIKPAQAPAVLEDDNVAKQELMNHQVDAIVTDLPSALYMTAVEIPKGVIIGQFKDPSHTEQFGLVLAKHSQLTACVDWAIAHVKARGTLAALEKRWLSGSVHVPVFDFTMH